MAVRTSRDWRGVKHRLSEYSALELVSVMANARQTRAQLDDFMDKVVAELATRNGPPGATAA
jgi:hypothetical protein